MILWNKKSKEKSKHEIEQEKTWWGKREIKRIIAQENRSRQDNLRFDGIAEYENKSWTETEDIVKGTSNEISGIRNIQIERAHHIGDDIQEENKWTQRAVVTKFSYFKIKERIFEEAKKKVRDRYSDLPRLFERIYKIRKEM